MVLAANGDCCAGVLWSDSCVCFSSSRNNPLEFTEVDVGRVVIVFVVHSIDGVVIACVYVYMSVCECVCESV